MDPKIQTFGDLVRWIGNYPIFFEEINKRWNAQTDQITRLFERVQALEMASVKIRPIIPRAEEEFKAAVVYLKRALDGKILVVWNKRYGGWAMREP